MKQPSQLLLTTPLFPWRRQPSHSVRLWKERERLPSTSSPLTYTHHLNKPWWNEDCAQAVQARRRTWNRWLRTPPTQAVKEYSRLDAICAKTILQAKRRAWGSHCSSLSFSSSLWDDYCFHVRDPSLYAERITEVIISGMELYIPHTFSNYKAKKPWFNSACSRAVKDREATHKRHRSHSSAENHALYISVHKHAKFILRLTKNSFINRKS